MVRDERATQSPCLVVTILNIYLDVSVSNSNKDKETGSHFITVEVVIYCLPFCLRTSCNATMHGRTYIDLEGLMHNYRFGVQLKHYDQVRWLFDGGYRHKLTMTISDAVS